MRQSCDGEMEGPWHVHRNAKDTCRRRSLVVENVTYLGIRDFVEDFIKQAHQIERTEDNWTRKLRDRRLATYSNSKWEWILLHLELIGAMIIKKDKIKKRKRNEPSKKAIS
jgi:hypothetical protein